MMGKLPNLHFCYLQFICLSLINAYNHYFVGKNWVEYFFWEFRRNKFKIDNEIQQEQKSFFKETNLKLDRGNPR